MIFTSSGVGVTGFANISPYASSKGAIESLAKCLEIENLRYDISFHLFHPPLTDTASAAGLPIPKEFKANAQKVGYGLADHLWSKKFVICHSTAQLLQIKLSYRHPLRIGKMMTKMTERAAQNGQRMLSNAGRRICPVLDGHHVFRQNKSAACNAAHTKQRSQDFPTVGCPDFSFVTVEQRCCALYYRSSGIWPAAQKKLSASCCQPFGPISASSAAAAAAHGSQGGIHSDTPIVNDSL